MEPDLDKMEAMCRVAALIEECKAKGLAEQKQENMSLSVGSLLLFGVTCLRIGALMETIRVSEEASKTLTKNIELQKSTEEALKYALEVASRWEARLNVSAGLTGNKAPC